MNRQKTDTELCRIIELYRQKKQNGEWENRQIYAIISNSTAIEEAELNAEEVEMLLEKGIRLANREQKDIDINIDLANAYRQMFSMAEQKKPITAERLKELASYVMEHTGALYNTILGSFSAAKGELRLFNVTSGYGGRSYLSYSKVPAELEKFCHQTNEKLSMAEQMSEEEVYRLSFDAHYHLVTIHPWADGNGRMSRLIMHYIQRCCGLPMVLIHAEQKEEYFKALADTREQKDIYSILSRFV